MPVRTSGSRKQESHLHQDRRHRVAQFVRRDCNEFIARSHRLSQLLNKAVLVYLTTPIIPAVTGILHAVSSSFSDQKQWFGPISGPQRDQSRLHPPISQHD
jgi:hypothetical protein